MNPYYLLKAVFAGNAKGHFGQHAEDALVRKLFPKRTPGTYLDLGAFHPYKFSNTAYFWLTGWRGYNIDANPSTIRLFEKVRPRDRNIWTALIAERDYKAGVKSVALMLPDNQGDVGISAKGTVDQHLSAERAQHRSVSVPAIGVASLLDVHSIHDVDYLNVDVEGLDETIICDFDFSTCRPKVITIEDYSTDLRSLQASKITRTLEDSRYELIGRAGPTSIFRDAS